MLFVSYYIHVIIYVHSLKAKRLFFSWTKFRPCDSFYEFQLK